MVTEMSQMTTDVTGDQTTALTDFTHYQCCQLL